MKKTYLLLFSCFTILGCKTQNNTQIVNEFIQSYNDKDSLKTFNLLHKDFIELWEKDTVINTKEEFAKNYSWGIVMNDMEEIEIVKSDQNFIETISTYHSDRDKLLGITPYKSKRTYEIKDNKIVKISSGEFNGYNEYDKSRREQYEVFFEWLLQNYNLKPSDFPFDKNGAKKLKKLIIEYKKN